MDEATKRNNAAKAAIETALFDTVGKSFGLPAVALLGGAVRDRVPVLWTLDSGDPAQEAESKLTARLHRTSKVKVGVQEPTADMARMRRLARALEGRATLVADANQAWDETTAAAACRSSPRWTWRWWSSPCRPGTSPLLPGCAPVRARSPCSPTKA